MARSHSPLEQGSGKPNSTQEHDAAREVTGASGPISRQSERVEDRHPRMSLGPGYIFLICFFAFFAWRWSGFFVWDDTASASYNMYASGGHFSMAHTGTVFYEPFAYL